jgi:hydroxyacylglutathione hydrolase
MILRTYPVGQLGTNCYLIASESTHEAMLVDPGGDAAHILEIVRQLQVQVRHIVLTHFHFDHILAVESVRQATGAPLAIHQDDAEALTNPPTLFRFFAPQTPRGIVAERLLQDGDNLMAGELSGQVLHTPGHSPGGISLWFAIEKVVLTGDALFREGLGRTDFPGASHDELVRSIQERLFTLPDETVVYPGHGPATTIGHERQHNPWVGAVAR